MISQKRRYAIYLSGIIAAASLYACGGSGDSGDPQPALEKPALGFVAPGNTYDLANYTLTGRYSLPTDPNSPTNKLANEASAVTWNKDTNTLFVVGDGGTSVVQVSKTGALIDSMALALDPTKAACCQGTYFYDPEGVAYIGGGKFVLIEERFRQVNEFTYAAGTTLGGSQVRTVKLGTTLGNIGIEGVSFDPASGGYVFAKEVTPQGVFQSKVDFAAGTATNGSPTTENSTNLFDPALLGLETLSDIYAMSNVLTSTAPDYQHLLILSATSGKVVKTDRAGKIASTLVVGSTAKNEGITMDGNGVIYIVNEEGGGSVTSPELWVYTPTTSKSAVGLGSNLYLTFNQPVKAGSGSIVLSNGAGDSRTLAVTDATQVSISGNTVTINPTVDLIAGKAYTIAYAQGAFTNISGNPAPAATGTDNSFTTLADTSAPKLASSLPVDDATAVKSNHIVLTYSEPVQAGTGNIVITGGADVRTISVNDITQVTISGSTVDINPHADLLLGTSYNVQFTAGVITDKAGNPAAGITTPTGLNFFTDSGIVTSSKTLLITEVNSNAAGDDFFELFNFGSVAVDLSGWRWDDDSANSADAGSGAFPAGTTISPGGRLVVSKALDSTAFAAFKAAWGLADTVPAVFVGGPGLGGGDMVVLFDSAGKVVASFDYKNVSVTASDGTVISPSLDVTGAACVLAHAGQSCGAPASAKTSAVWNGVSVINPRYQAAVVGVLGGFAQPADATAVGSPGQ